MQIQDTIGSDDELDILPPSKTAMVCKLAQIPPEIWKTLLIETKKWLLNERKVNSQQQEDRKTKKPFSLNMDTEKAPDKNDKNSNNPSMSIQYARVKIE